MSDVEQDGQPAQHTWTFMGHWEQDRIVVEHAVPGEVEDVRQDTGHWEQGLWAASGTGATLEEAEANAKAEYEAEANAEVVVAGDDRHALTLTDDDVHVLLDAVTALRDAIRVGAEPWFEYMPDSTDPKSTRSGYLALLDGAKASLDEAMS